MKRLWYYLLLTGIALFVLSMAVLWHDNTATEDTSPIATWAAAIFLAFMVCGPSLLAKQLFTLLVPVEALAKNRRRLKREIAKAEATQTKAKEEKTRIQSWHGWYVQESNKMRSIYLLNYKEAGGRKAENPYKLRSVG
jgi:hypothetical protein